MAPEDPTGTRPAPVVLRIKLRYDDVEAMAERFAPHVGRSGLFLPTRSLQPIGTEVKFELRLANDKPVLVGLGRVQTVKEPDPEQPKATYGIGVELMRVTRESRELILKLLARRKELGLPEVALPRAEEIDAARAMAAVPAAAPASGAASASGPVAAPAAAAAQAQAAQAPAAQAQAAEAQVAQAQAAQAQGDHLMTAPRRTTRPQPIPKAAEIAPLAAEAPRKKRRQLSELIESASGPVAAPISGPVLDDDVDVGKALARARALASGGDLDSELEQLRDQAAAPRVEISVEAASAELARQLGGASVRRDKSQGWAPPPAVEAKAEAAAEAVPVAEEAKAIEPEPAAPEAEAKAVEPEAVEPEAVEPEAVEPEAVEPEAVEPEAVEPEAEPEAVEPEAVEPEAEAEPVELDAIESEAAEPEPEPEPENIDDSIDRGVIERDEEDLAHLSFESDLRRALIPTGAEPQDLEVEEAQIADVIHQLGDGDYEEVEHTEIGNLPVAPGTLDEPLPAAAIADPEATAAAATAYPDEPAALAAHIDAHLAEAEAEAAADDLGIGDATAAAYSRDRALSSGGAYDSAVVEGLLDAAASAQAPPAHAPYAANLHGSIAAIPAVDPAPLNLDALSDALPADEEVDEFEILAETLASDGEADADPDAAVRTGVPSGDDEDDDADAQSELEATAHLPHTTAPRQPSLSDFAARLDLGEDSIEAEAYDPARSRSSEIPRNAFVRYGTEGSYTAAETPRPSAPELEFEARHADFPPLPELDESDVISLPAELRRGGRPGPPARAESPDLDLETALEALDVDLDDLSIPHAATELYRDGPQPPRGVARPLRSASSVAAQRTMPTQPTVPASPRAAPQRTAAPTPQRQPAPTPQRAAAPTPQRTAAPTPQRTAAPTPQRTAAPTPQRQAAVPQHTSPQQPGSGRVMRPASTIIGQPGSGRVNRPTGSTPPQGQAHAGPAARPAPAAPSSRARRPPADDGILIDFDDDDE